MRWRTTLALVVAFAALLAFTLLHERGGKTTEEASREAKRVFHFEEKDVRSIRVVRPDGAVRLERIDGDRWKMTEPVQARADRWSAGSAAGALSEMEAQRTVKNERGATGLAEMGLAPPRARVEFTVAGAATASGGGPRGAAPAGDGGAGPAKTEPVLTLELGGDVPTTSSVFLRLAGKDEILLVPSSSAAPFLKPVEDFRDRALVDLTILDVGEAVLSRPAGDVRFRRRDEDWWVEQPIEDLAAGDAVQSLLSAVIGLRAETFIDTPLASGLDAPREMLRLLDRKGKEIASVRLGDPVPGQTDRRYARADNPDGRGPVVTVATGGLESLSRAAAEFRSRKALTFRSWEATALKMTSPRATLAFQKKDGSWSALPPAPPKVAPEEIEKTLQQLSELSIASFEAQAPPAARGFEPPRARIEVSGESGGAAHVLEIGAAAAPPRTVYARDPNRPGVFVVDASILERIDGGATVYAAKSAAPGKGAAPASTIRGDEDDEEPGAAGGTGAGSRKH